MSIDRTFRINKELKDLFKNPLDKDNIFIDVDDNNINIIKCMIIGGKDTPYENGFFLFTLRFTDMYPLTPPVVWFYTTKSKMRINPNLYTNGKVCLSIINTWGNDSNWTPSMTIRSILLSIQSMVLINNPIFNEPGLKISTISNNNYNNAVRYFVCDCAIKSILVDKLVYNLENNKILLIDFESFRGKIEEYFIENILDYVNLLKNNYKILGDNLINTPPPFERFYQKVNYKGLMDIIMHYYSKISGNELSNDSFTFSSIDLKSKLCIKLKHHLIQLCRDNKIKGYSRLKKEDIIELLVSNNIKID